jgi:mercuric ion transport protein
MSENTRTVAVEEVTEMAPAGDEGSRQGLIATGGILGALAAASCCILPLVLTLAGISGAWMANLRALAPYQPIFIAMTIAVLGYGFYLVYWKPKRACTEGAVCARPIVPNKMVQGALWLATLVVVLAISFPYWFPMIVPFLP